MSRSLRAVAGMSILTPMLFIGCSSGIQGTLELPEDRNAKGTIIHDVGLQQAQTVKNWFTKDPVEDGVEGVSVDRAYREMGLKRGAAPVIVAVIDSGVDITHEDLQGKLWINKGETAGNGIDDDKNGYIDDVNGWNFLGFIDKATGKLTYVHSTTLEVTRETVRMKALKTAREAIGQTLTPEEAKYLEEVSTVVQTAREEAQEMLSQLLSVEVQLKGLFEKLKSSFTVGFEELTLDIVKAVQPADPDLLPVKEEMVKVMTDNNIPNIARLKRLVARFSSEVNFYYNESLDPRREIIGDDVSDFTDISYGNNDVKGPDSFHGTHVSGIIAATRGNNLGIEGVADDVLIMPIRAVPDGDEYDKDVANAVRYAVDNGARVINMSFGKGYSPEKSKVDQAFAYAASKGVVIVHSAGNDAKLTTPFNNFPNKYVKSVPGATIGNWLEVGASAAPKGPELPAFFSNFGKESVDLFAPGYLIESTVPDSNKYGVASGTSMAGPVVAGVAAVVISQHPMLNGAEVRDVLRQNARTYHGLEVKNPAGDPLMILFSKLSSTGGIVDALTSLKNALLPN